MSRRFGTSGTGATDNVAITHHAAIDALAQISMMIRSYKTGAGGNGLGRFAAKADQGTTAAGNDWGWYDNNSSGASQLDTNRWPTAGQWTWNEVGQSEWHTVQVRYDFGSTANNAVGFLDNVKRTTTRVTAPSGTQGPGTANISIGNSTPSAGARVFQGDLADFAIWNRLLSDGEFSIAHFLGPVRVANGLVVFMPMDGEDSPEPNRAVGTGALKNGTVTNATKGRLVKVQSGGAGLVGGRISRFGV
jgi:hypothetical protein